VDDANRQSSKNVRDSELSKSVVANVLERKHLDNSKTVINTSVRTRSATSLPIAQGTKAPQIITDETPVAVATRQP
jgi:hypothetical protein